MGTVDDIRAERERREAVARERAGTLPPADYYVSGRTLYRRGAHTVLVCESHTDAVMVMLAAPKA